MASASTEPRPAPKGALLLVVGLVLFAFEGVRQNGFVSFDDPDYISANPLVNQGLSFESIRWAFTGTAGANWHPLTWLAHMLDVELFGLDAGAHHLSSLALHLLAVGLLFLFLWRATADRLAAGVAALLFGLHPLRVESVAWAAEKKDVLSVALAFAALCAYERYARAPGRKRYALVTCLVVLGLLSKSMLVSLPLVFLLGDVWPLGRLERGVGWGALVREKLPWLALSLVVVGVTVASQGDAGALRSSARLDLLVRLENGLGSLAVYVGQTLWPARLTFFHPHPALFGPPGAGFHLAALLGAACLALAAWLGWRWRGTRPWFGTGVALFVLLLLPVLGLIQVGNQAHADRYTYLPSLGLAVLVAGGLAELSSRRADWRPRLGALAAVAVLACAWQTRVLVRGWRDSETLYTRAFEIDQRNFVAALNLANLRLDQGRAPEALLLFEGVVALLPENTRAWRNLGVALVHLGRLDEAEVAFRRALELDPDDREARAGLGNALARAQRFAEAREMLEGVLAEEPEHVGALHDLAGVLAGEGRLEEALKLFDRVLALRPDHGSAPINRQRLLEAIGRP